MTNQMLKGIRVPSKQEFEGESHLHFEKVNEEPAVSHQPYKFDETSKEESGLHICHFLENARKHDAHEGEASH